MTNPGCRISRVRFKAGGNLTLLPTRPAPDDSQLVPTLVWALEHARLGEVVGFAAVFAVDRPDGSRVYSEAATVSDSHVHLSLLGSMRRMEANFLAREGLLVNG